MKIYLCGITQNEEKNIEELTANYNDYDGLIFVDGGSTDRTADILNERKKGGKIIYRKWTNDHDFQQNEFLRCGVLQLGDWFVFRDSSERVNPDFSKVIRDACLELEAIQIRTCFSGGKIALVKYHPEQVFFGSPHFGLQCCIPKYAEMEKCGSLFYESAFYSLRSRTDEEWILHDIKYVYQYDRSNHNQLYYKNSSKLNEQDMFRIAFRDYCIKVLGLEPTVQSLINYLQSTKDNLPTEVKECINNCRVYNNLYKLVCLNIPAAEIRETIKEREDFVSSKGMVII